MISLDEAVSIFRQNCSNHDFEAPIVYRGIRHHKMMDGQYALVKPGEYNREGGFSNTTYLNLIDGSEEWNDYPKRRKSIICSTSPTIARSFGEVFVVIPFDNAKFGICPSYDFQQCFDAFYKIFGFRLHNINMFFDILDHDGISYDEIKNRLKNKKYYSSGTYATHIRNNNISGEEVFNHVLELISPEKNGFRIGTQSDLERGDNLGYEVWTDSNAILIKSMYYREFLKAIDVDLEYASKLML